MLKNSVKTPGIDIRTNGYVLRRTNYGEADRILNIITPEGKIPVIAKGVRKSKSKLAGSVEMFSLIDFNIHCGKSEFGVVTGAKMLKYYDQLLKDYAKIELMGMILKKISQIADSLNDASCFEMVDQCMKGLNEGMNSDMVEAWFLLNIAKMMGEEVNLYRDCEGAKLEVDKKYDWNISQSAFFERKNGKYDVNEIKMMRVMTTNKLLVVRRVRTSESFMREILEFARVATRV